MMTSVNVTGAPPTMMAFAQLLAKNVTDVVLNALRVHPGGAAVLEEKSDPEFSRKRTW